ncbi:MAG: RNA methyltransferase [Planctomycetota bacterium]|nr:MAG: RNA methyltransferase [Planctomycetota bacterium]
MLIESTRNRHVKEAGALRSSHNRVKAGRVLVEGRKAVLDALRSGVEPVYALVRAGFGGARANEPVLEELERRGVAIHPVTPPVFDKISSTERSQGIVLVAQEPRWRREDLLREGDTRPVVVLEELQDPGNLGATLRSAAALGFRGAILTRGTTDPYGAKVVRAAAATVFRFPVLRTGENAAEILAWLREHGFVPIAAAPGGDPPEVALRAVGGPVALVIGSEGRGLRSETLDLVERRVWIPIEPGVESLNAGVAFGILAYVLSRQLRG